MRARLIEHNPLKSFAGAFPIIRLPAIKNNIPFIIFGVYKRAQKLKNQEK